MSVEYYCCSMCNWIGYESELKEKCVDDTGIKLFEDICPNCGNKEFYIERGGTCSNMDMKL